MLLLVTFAKFKHREIDIFMLVVLNYQFRDVLTWLDSFSVSFSGIAFTAVSCSLSNYV